MKIFMVALIAATTMMTSQANTPLKNGALYTEINPYAIQHQIVTPNALAHVKHKRIVKSKVQRAQPFGLDDGDDDVVQNDDLATGYRRRDLTKIEHPDGISEYVRWRLFLARQLALMKYREKSSQHAAFT
jgi:hypothetical protein